MSVTLGTGTNQTLTQEMSADASKDIEMGGVGDQ
jgi:hypothetical protein